MAGTVAGGGAMNHYARWRLHVWLHFRWLRLAAPLQFYRTARRWPVSRLKAALLAWRMEQTVRGFNRRHREAKS